MRVKYGFSDIESALAKIHRIADDKRSPFANRLKHLQRIGFPPGVNTGRGIAAAYLAHHYFLIAVALELYQFGITAERADALILASMGELALGVRQITDDHGKGQPIFCDVPAWYLDDLGAPKLFGRGLALMPLIQVVARLQGYGSGDAMVRCSMFSLSGLVKGLPRAIRPDDPAHADDFLSDLRDWSLPVASEWEDYIRREKDIATLQMMHEEGEPNGERFAKATGLKAEWDVIVSGGNDGQH